MSLAQRIAANRAEKELSSIDVEEWGEGDQAQTLFFTEVSARDMSKIQKKHPDFINNPTMDAMVEMIILKCQNADGEKAFDVGDKFILMGEPLVLIAKVFGAVFETVSVEEHEKN
jgi:hypothetical protein